MSIQDLVLDALQTEDVAEVNVSSAEEMFRSDITNGDFLHRGREIEKSLPDLDLEQFHHQTSILAAGFLSLGRRRPGHGYRGPVASRSRCPSLVGSEIAVRAADVLYSGESRETLLRFIHQALDNHYLDRILKGEDERVAILEELWGDDLVRRLAIYGRVKEATAKRWLAGASAASAMWEIYRTSDIVYHLRSSTDFSLREIRTWFDTPLEDGQTPFTHVRDHSATQVRGREIIHDPLTEELERLGIVAFSWAAEL